MKRLGSELGWDSQTRGVTLPLIGRRIG